MSSRFPPLRNELHRSPTYSARDRTGGHLASFPATLVATIFTQTYVGSAICLIEGWDVDKALWLIEKHAGELHGRPFARNRRLHRGHRSRSAAHRVMRTILHGGSKGTPSNTS